MALLFPSTTANNQSTIQAMNGVNPDLIARFQSLQTFLLYTGIDNSKRLSTELAQEVLKLGDELSTSFSTCTERVEMESCNPLTDGRIQSDASRSNRMGSGQRAQEKRMVYESRVLTAVAVICGHYAEVAQAILNLGNEENAQEADGNKFINVLIEVLAVITNTVKMISKFQKRLFSVD